MEDSIFVEVMEDLAMGEVTEEVMEEVMEEAMVNSRFYILSSLLQFSLLNMFKHFKGATMGLGIMEDLEEIMGGILEVLEQDCGDLGGTFLILEEREETKKIC